MFHYFCNKFIWNWMNFTTELNKTTSKNCLIAIFVLIPQCIPCLINSSIFITPKKCALNLSGSFIYFQWHLNRTGSIWRRMHFELNHFNTHKCFVGAEIVVNPLHNFLKISTFRAQDRVSRTLAPIKLWSPTKW